MHFASHLRSFLSPPCEQPVTGSSQHWQKQAFLFEESISAFSVQVNFMSFLRLLSGCLVEQFGAPNFAMLWFSPDSWTGFDYSQCKSIWTWHALVIVTPFYNRFGSVWLDLDLLGLEVLKCQRKRACQEADRWGRDTPQSWHLHGILPCWVLRVWTLLWLPRICFTFKGILTMSCFECPSSWFQERTDRLYSGFQAGNQVTGINKITYTGVEAQTFTKQTMRSSSTQLKETYNIIQLYNIL